MADVHSFDVFDTLVSRDTFNPFDIFLEVYPNLGPVAQKRIGRGALQFARARSVAEAKVRLVSPEEEVTIDEILDFFISRYMQGCDVEALKNVERSLELACAVPIGKLQQRAKALLSAGEPVVFVSDMYWDAHTLRCILSRTGLNVATREIYVSSDLRMTKRSGSLYRHVLYDLGIEAQGLKHCGDNLVSDVDIPRSLGIQAESVALPAMPELYVRSMLGQKHLGFSVREKFRKVSKLGRIFFPSPDFSTSTEEYLANSRYLAGIRNFRASDSDGVTSDPLTDIVDFVACPLILAFVSWVLLQAREMQLKRLYFVARNGWIFYQVAEYLVRRLGLDIELRYIFLSRSVLYPSRLLDNLRSLPNLLALKFPSMTVAEILSEIGCRKGDIDSLRMLVPESRRRSFDRVLDRVATASNLQLVLAVDEQKVVEASLAARHDLLCDYLTQEGVFDDVNKGFVDIGWHLSAHQALYSAIKPREDHKVVGFYLGVGARRESPPLCFPAYGFYDETESPELHWLFRLGPMALMEEVFCGAEHGTTTGFERIENKIVPKLKNGCSTLPWSETVSGRVSHRVVRIARFFSRGRPLEYCDLKWSAIRQYGRFYNRPEKREVLAIQNVSVYALTSHNEKQARTLALPLTALELVKIAISVSVGRRGEIDPHWVWFQGSIELSSFPVRLFGRLLSRLERARLSK